MFPRSLRSSLAIAPSAAASRMTLNLAPMVDVMMCLIIFFLLASEIVDAQYRPVQLAVAASAEDVERSRLGPRVVINVTPDPDGISARYQVSGLEGARLADRDVSVDALPAFLASRQRQAEAAGHSLCCVIRADESVSYGHVEVILRACGLTKIPSIVFSARRGEAEP